MPSHKDLIEITDPELLEGEIINIQHNSLKELFLYRYYQLLRLIQSCRTKIKSR